MLSFINEYKDEYIKTLNSLRINEFELLYQLLEEKKEQNKKVFILGNGGSSASASHWVCDFNKGSNFEDSKRIQLYSLTDNVPILSAIGNDISYEDIFIEQLKNYLSTDDLVIGLSVSGNSENIIRALKYANEVGAETFSIIGDYDGRMINSSENYIKVSSKNYGIVEDVHMYICHVISQYMHLRNKNK